MTRLRLSIGAGLALGLLYTSSPLTMVTLAALVPLLLLSRRGLSTSEQRLLTGILLAAVGARLLAIAGLAVIGIPHHNELAVGSLAGDNAYYLGRALRARDMLVGFAQSKYDFFVVDDEYGRTSYLSLLTLIQVIFGPTPFGMRALNALLFVAGATLLFRVTRRAFGPLPSFVGLVGLLFLPSLAVVSTSLLKESLYFFFSSLLLYCSVRLFELRSAFKTVLAVAVVAGSLWLLDDLRRGALILAGSGIALGIAIRVVGARRWAIGAATAAIVVALVAGLSIASVRARAVDAVVAAAKMHGGHVFTIGHAYKLLDEEFYMNPAAPNAWPLTLTEPQAARFVVRAGVSFLATPLPWEIMSLGELAFLPEHVLWYVMLIGLPAGVAAGWRRNPLVTSLLIGYVLPTAAAVAVTNGNVGTLLRMRGLVTPYIIWLSVLGILAMAESLIAARRAPHASATRLAEEPSA